MPPAPAGARFHTTERFGLHWLAMSYPKQGYRSGRANRLIHECESAEEAAALADEMNRRHGCSTRDT